VTDAADDAGKAASDLNGAAGSLSAQSASLREAVDTFLARVRAA
jgi:hypothetical protein